eukprot:1131453-Prorocentrum_minimum.AAC.2
MSRGPSSQAPHVAWSIVAGSRWPRERLAFSAPPESPSRFPGWGRETETLNHPSFRTSSHQGTGKIRAPNAVEYRALEPARFKRPRELLISALNLPPGLAERPTTPHRPSRSEESWTFFCGG